MSLRDCIPDLPQDRQVIAFYSYKGGVGRTMALCNVAAQIARQHSKRMTDCLRKPLGAKPKPMRLLCVDLDLEAPGIPAYLPPARGSKVKGVLGLLGEYFGKDGRPVWEGDTLEEELRRALGPELTEYAYAVPDTDNLFVLPTGTLETDETVRVRRALEDLLEPIRRSDSLGKAEIMAPFFSSLRIALRELFDYAFIDSRTGLAETSYATTTVLADAMVFLFRPNLTQLMGIQDVFGRFLIEHSDIDLEGQPKRIPAIPVLSPRPNYSTPRLQEVRKAAAERIFRWLDPNASSTSPMHAATDRYSPAPPKLQELPFDSSLEIGERLMIPPNPATKVEDEQAPLYIAYVQLAEEIQKRNTERDALAAKLVEKEHWLADRKDEALNWLLAAIAAEPADSKLWGNIWEGYSAHLRDSQAARNLVMRFCEEARRLPEDQSVPRFFGSLWLSEVYESIAPGECPQLITELWVAACRVMDATMLKYGLVRIIKHHNKHGSEPTLDHCPSRAQADAAWMLRRLQENLNVSGLFDTLVGAEDYYQESPEAGTQGLDLLHDQLCLAEKSSTRAAILRDIAESHLLQGDLRSAYRAYAAAVELPECSESVKQSFIFMQMGILPRRTVEKCIRTILPKILQQGVIMMLEVREGAEVHAVRARLEDLRKISPTVAEDPSFEYYALMHHRRFQEALVLMDARLGKIKGGVEVTDLSRLRLAQWLASDAKIDNQMIAYARAKVTSPQLVLNEPDFDICLALACCPKDLGNEAAERLSQPQWPITKFGWLFIACITEQEYRKCRNALETMLKENPYLALMFRKQEDFPLLRFILEKQASLGVIDAGNLRRRTGVIDLIESVKASIRSSLRPMKVPKRISTSDDPRFKKIMKRWTSNLAWIRDDKEMGPLVDKLLEVPIESDAGLER